MSVSVAVESLNLVSGTAQNVVFTNTDTTEKIVKIWATCADMLSPALGTNPTGKECVTENWLSARVAAGSWVALGFPVTFAAAFADLADDHMLTFSLPASSTVTIEFLLAIPAGAESSGTINWSVAWRWADA